MRIIRLLLPYLVADITALALGCARPSHRDLNVMTMPAVCDTAPPHREGSAPVIPSLAAPRAPFGAVVGAVSEVGTGLALPYATIDLARSDSAPPGRLLAADSLGGFALDTIPSGTYRLRVRFHLTIGSTYGSSASRLPPWKRLSLRCLTFSALVTDLGGCLKWQPNQRLKLSGCGGRLKGNRSVLIAAAAPRSLSAIR